MDRDFGIEIGENNEVTSILRDNHFNTLAFCAFRYALGRKSYICSDIVDILIENMDRIDRKHINLIIDEIDGAIENNNAGMDCDKKEWSRLRDALERHIDSWSE